MLHSPALRYQARWAFLPGGVVEDSPVAVIAGGRLVEWQRGPDRHAMDLGDVAFAPGFVNAHVHLDLPGPTIPSAGRHPTAWLAEVVAARRNPAGNLIPAQDWNDGNAPSPQPLSRGGERGFRIRHTSAVGALAETLDRNIAASLAAGTTFVGDIAATNSTAKKSAVDEIFGNLS